MDIKNFENFTETEYRANLLRLSIVSHCDLIDKEVYYSKPTYGKHKVLLWDEDRGEYLLAIDGHKFWTNPFRIHRCG